MPAIIRKYPDRIGYVHIKQMDPAVVDRAERAGLVRRRPDRDDHRIVHVGLTAAGSRRLAALSTAHLEELQRLSPEERRLVVDYFRRLSETPPR